MTARLRVVSYTVQPQVMLDDGEHLSPVQLNPVVIPAVEWPNVVMMMADALAAMQAEYDSRETQTEQGQGRSRAGGATTPRA